MITRGTSIVDFFTRFPDEEACLAQIFESKWGEHSPCPECGVTGGWAPIAGTKKYRHRCRRQFSPLRGTAFYRSNLSLMAIFYTILLFSNLSTGARSTFLKRQLGIGLRAAHRLCNRVRLHMAAYSRPTQLGGHGKVVYVDEVYLRYATIDGQKRRGSHIVLGFACEGIVVSGIVPDRKSHTLLAAIKKVVLPGTTIVTDCWTGYAKVADLGYNHVSINHSRGHFFDFQGNSTCEIDTYWAVVRRSLRLSHQVSENNLWLFLAEIECRYNNRHSGRSLFDMLVECWPDLDRIGVDTLRARFDWR